MGMPILTAHRHSDPLPCQQSSSANRSKSGGWDAMMPRCMMIGAGSRYSNASYMYLPWLFAVLTSFLRGVHACRLKTAWLVVTARERDLQRVVFGWFCSEVPCTIATSKSPYQPIKSGPSFSL